MKYLILLAIATTMLFAGVASRKDFDFNRNSLLVRMADLDDSDDDLRPSGRGKITTPLKVLTKQVREWWNKAPGWVKDMFEVEAVLNAMDKVFEVSDSIEDLFYRTAKDLGANDTVARAFSKVVSIVFLPRRA